MSQISTVVGCSQCGGDFSRPAGQNGYSHCEDHRLDAAKKLAADYLADGRNTSIAGVLLDLTQQLMDKEAALDRLRKDFWSERERATALIKAMNAAIAAWERS